MVRSFVLSVMAAVVALAPAPAVAAGVIIAEATRVDYPLKVEALGTARANESVEIRPKISETITAIRFTEGQQVEAGDVLVELEDAEARAAVAAARANLVDATSRYGRAQELHRSQLVPESELESLAARRDAAQAALDAAEARLSNTVVTAPFAGRLGLRRVSAGSLVGPSIIITTLDDTDIIKVDFDVPETALSHVATGLPIVAHSAAWRDTVFDGKVKSIDTRVDPVSRTITVRALVDNRQRLLRPGMFLTVELLRRDISAIVIPEQAIVPEQSRQFVLVVDGDGVVEKREIRVGRRRPGQVEVLAGLAEGERVVAEGTQKAQDGQTVEIIGEMEVGP